MTVLTLAISLSGAALNAANATDYRLDEAATRKFADSQIEESAAQRRWTIAARGWTRERTGCRALFERPFATGSVFRFGPRCEDEQLPNDTHRIGAVR